MECLLNAIIIDIDGTLMDNDKHIGHDEEIANNDYEWFSPLIPTFIPSDWAITLINSLAGTVKIIFITARIDTRRGDTRLWIDKWFKFNSEMPYKLLMRPFTSVAKDYKLKETLYFRYVRDNYNVLCAFDDKKEILNMYREYNIPTMNVKY